MQHMVLAGRCRVRRDCGCEHDIVDLWLLRILQDLALRAIAVLWLGLHRPCTAFLHEGYCYWFKEAYEAYGMGNCQFNQ